MAISYRINMILPWSSSEEEDTRFKKILLLACGVVLVLGLLTPLLSVPEIERDKLEKLPPQLAKILLEKKKQPPPPKPKSKPKPKPKKKAEKAKPKEKPKPKPEPKPVELVQQAREKASRSGLMALQDDLAEMRESVDVSAVSSQTLSKGGKKASQTDRSLITSKSTATSGGINTDKMSRSTAGGDLASRKTTQVEAPAAAVAASSAKSQSSQTGEGMPRRSEESIRSVLDQNKGAIYAIYNRALRKDPSLEGKITVRVEIAANGSVVSCKVVSSEMDNATMERKLVSRIKLINFGSQDVGQTVFDYTFDFLPF